jgi:hypothetical protein
MLDVVPKVNQDKELALHMEKIKAIDIEGSEILCHNPSLGLVTKV